MFICIIENQVFQVLTDYCQLIVQLSRRKMRFTFVSPPLISTVSHISRPTRAFSTQFSTPALLFLEEKALEMWWVVLTFLVLTLLLSAFCLNIFIRLRSQPLYLSATLVLSLFLPLSIIFILPIDLISTSIDNSRSSGVSLQGNQSSIFYLDPRIVIILWRVNYWTTFVLTWVILPFLQSWFSSGYHKVRDRLKDALVDVLKFQLLMLVCAVAFLVYLLFAHRDWLSFTTLKSLVITVSHLYALVIALWLMAHGLVAIPREKYLHSGFYESRLFGAYCALPSTKERYDDAKFEFRECCGKVCTLRQLQDSNLDFRDWIIDLVNQVPDQFVPSSSHVGFAYSGERLTAADLSAKKMNQLTTEFQRKKNRLDTEYIHFQNAVDEIIKLEDKVNAQLLKELNPRLTPSSAWGGFLVRHPRLSYMLSQYWNPWFGRFTALCLAGLSVIVVESEVLHGTKASLINLVINGLTKNSVRNHSTAISQIFMACLVTLSYMLLSAMFSLSKIRVFNMYHLSPHQSSDPVSATFFLTYAARLTIPLSYNFLMLLSTDFTLDSGFQKFLGNSIKLIPAGAFLNSLLPRLILIPLLLSFLNVWDRMKKWFKGTFLFEQFFDEFDYDEDTQTRLLSRTNEQTADPERLTSAPIIGTPSNAREAALVQEAKNIVQRELHGQTSVIPSSTSGTGIDSRVITSAPRPFQLSTTRQVSSPFRSKRSLSRSSSMQWGEEPGVGNRVFGGQDPEYVRSEEGADAPLTFGQRVSSALSNVFGRKNNSAGAFELGRRGSTSTMASSANDFSMGSRADYETDNRLLRDEEILNIDDEEEEDERLML
ncbi:unnamed protein product [Kuraishia capsulata CBS 1993]|uniref:LMBR1 domain-containing protein n=1 Tax=Kuraishia capsulata CBS 1993 TaxID=1382522 RepID=W6MIP1_9ASCO|nr:uncharacterized protein KUCA_T00001972001 [Kuraishia capsulata CBS 1993]CDK26001.1 unnamed protein product [Kuraishia capsulata CBS 1993]